jgi:hypothetical protein
MGIGGTVLGRVLIAAAGAELCDSLDTNVQGFQLLSNDAVRHPLPEILNQQPHAAALWQGARVKTHALPDVKGP